MYNLNAFDKVDWSAEKQLTKEEAESIMIHFKDYCVRHRTKDFLWEFCYGKYLRQYDDKMTIANAMKAGPELFFLGFLNPNDSARYELIITKDSGDYNPPREYFEKDIRSVLYQEKYVQTLKNIVLLSDIFQLELYDHSTLLSLIVFVPANQLTNTTVLNPKGQTINDNLEGVHTRVINGELHYRLERLVRVIVDANTFILSEPFPFDIATNHVTIEIYVSLMSTTLLILFSIDEKA